MPSYESEPALPDDGNAPGLLVDAMLGRLVRWLRLAGYDAAYTGPLPDAQVARWARVEGRLLVTRDNQLATREGVHSLLIRSQELPQQLAEVAAAVGVAPGAPFSRCPVCNEPLLALPHEEAVGKVPPYVLASQPSFRRCPGCHRIYWRATHWRRITGFLEAVGACPPPASES